MQDFAVERINHADCPIAYGTHHRVIHAAAFDQLTDEDALIYEGYVKISSNKTTIFVLDLARVGNDAVQSLRLEVLRK
jgi:hypothetical protein